MRDASEGRGLRGAQGVRSVDGPAEEEVLRHQVSARRTGFGGGGGVNESNVFVQRVTIIYCKANFVLDM